jgi:hypothetical protein
LELSQKSDQGNVAVKSDQQINKYTTNNYYITSGRKKSQQIAPPDLGRIRSKTCSIKIPCINDGKPRFFELPPVLKLISKHTLNIIYGILGSIVATALTGAIYSIINSGSDKGKTPLFRFIESLPHTASLNFCAIMEVILKSKHSWSLETNFSFSVRYKADPKQNYYYFFTFLRDVENKDSKFGSKFAVL